MEICCRGHHRGLEDLFALGLDEVEVELGGLGEREFEGEGGGVVDLGEGERVEELALF